MLLPPKSPGMTEPNSQFMPKRNFQFTISLFKQTNRVLSHKQIGLASSQLKHLCTDKSMQNICEALRSGAAKGKTSSFPFQLHLNGLHFTSLFKKGLKRNIRQERPLYFLAVLRKIHLSDLCTLYLYFAQMYFL